MTSRKPANLASLGRRIRSVYVWHRWLGLVAVLFVLLFAVTGLALNHTEQLKLDQRHFSGDFWLDLYQIDRHVRVQGLEVDGRWFSHARGRLYMDDRFIGPGVEPVDAIRLDQWWVLAGPTRLWLLDDNGVLLEKVEASSLPGRIIDIEADKDALLLLTPYAAFRGDLDSLQWRPVAGLTAVTATKQQPPEAIHASIVSDVLRQALSLERLMLDLHSGRLFGQLGIYVMDAAAVSLIVLGLTGLWLWLRYRRSQRRRKLRRQESPQ